MAGRNLESESYWPGYVDAIINVVLNILFMVALFTVALSTVDFAPPAPANEVASAPSPAPSAVTVPEPAPTLPPQPAQVAVPAQAFKPRALSQPEHAAAVWTSRTLEQGTRLLTVDFDDNAADIPPPQSRALSTALRGLNSEVAQGQWLIWVTSDTRQTSAARLAYLRVISVRSALVEAGVPPDLIQTRILDLRDNAATPSTRVQLALQAS